jgi:thiosulfate dehydrogenase (quinone) large subunit
MRALRRTTPAMALFPLRLFLGATFVYAGIQKLSDPGFLHPGAPTYIRTQLRGFADGTPGGVLLEPALSHAQVAGVAVAVAEIAIGLLVLAGLLTRLAAAAGLALNLVLFLTASWHTSPYFLGSDIVFAFAWLPLVLAGADGQPTIHDAQARRPLRRRGRVLTRRALLAQALGLVGLATAGAAAASTLARGSYHAPARTRVRTGATAAGGPRGVDLGPARALAPGEARPYSDPASGGSAIVVRLPGGGLVALGTVCTHAGCELVYRRGTLACPCHGSTFDLRTGLPERGPARRALPMARVDERDGRIVAGELR